MKRVTMEELRSVKKILCLLGLLVVIVPATASAVELRDAELVVGGEPVVQNGAGTIRLEDVRIGRAGGTLVVPEPRSLWQLVSGVGALGLLQARRRTRCSKGSRDHERNSSFVAGDAADSGDAP